MPCWAWPNYSELDDLTGTQQDAVQHILQGGRSLVGLVDNILGITKIQGGELELAMEIVATESLLSECLLQMTAAPVDRGVTLRYEPGAVAPTRADRGRLARVANLLSNAIRVPAGRTDRTELRPVRCRLAGHHRQHHPPGNQRPGPAPA